MPERLAEFQMRRIPGSRAEKLAAVRLRNTVGLLGGSCGFPWLAVAFLRDASPIATGLFVPWVLGAYVIIRQRRYLTTASRREASTPDGAPSRRTVDL